MGLVSIPSIIGKMDLLGLNISMNSLTEFPEEIISKQNGLLELYVGHNSFSSFPTSLNYMTWLKNLHVHNIQAAKTALDNLNLLSINELLFDGITGAFPKSVAKLTGITYLSFANCGYEEFPMDVMKLTNLQDLYFDNNNIKELPEDWSALTMLRELSFAGNPITKYPQGLKKLTMLTEFTGSGSVFCVNIKDFPAIFQSNCKEYNVFKQYFGLLLSVIIIAAVGALCGFFLISFRTGKRRERKKATKKITDAEASQADNVDVDTSPEKIGHNRAMAHWKIKTKKLSFISEGKLMDVGFQYSTDFEIENTSKEDMFFYILFPSRKNNYTVEIHPPYGDLEGGETMAIKVHMTLHCTTRVDEKMYVVMSHIRHCGMKEVKEHQTLQVLAQGKNSSRINYDDIRFEEVIGKGGFGIVSRGVWKGNSVAVKELRSLEEASVMDFMREVEILEQIKAPYILQFYGAVLTKERMCLVTEYMPYGSLMGVLRDFDLSATMRVRFMFDAVRGLYFLHTSNIMHRDIKSDNVLVCDLRLDASVVCKIADFGSSREVNADQTQLNMTKGIGTPYYMAPEILLGKKEYDFYADVYSIGVMLNEIWCQETPFKDKKFNGMVDLANFIIEGNRPRMREDCPEALSGIITTCWSPNPGERKQTADIVYALDDVFKEVSTAEGENASFVKERETSKRKKEGRGFSSASRGILSSPQTSHSGNSNTNSSYGSSNSNSLNSTPVRKGKRSKKVEMGSIGSTGELRQSLLSSK